MAIVRDNTITKGISGLVGKDILFQNRNGNTYLYKKFRKPAYWSPKQRETRTKFAMASSFAKEVIKDPAKKKEYKLLADKMGLTNAYTAALTEYMRKSEIDEPDTLAYHGNKGDEITMQVKKRGFDVDKVEVIIMNEKRDVIELGNATRAKVRGWIYKAQLNVGNQGKLYMVIKAKNRTGNVVEKEILLRS